MRSKISPQKFYLIHNFGYMSSIDHNSKHPPDGVASTFQGEIIRIATLRLGHPLSPELISMMRINRWGYMGLESIIDTIRFIEVDEIENYLSGLK